MNSIECRTCGAPGRKWGNRGNLCSKHHRFIQMRYSAKTKGKVMPTVSELESMRGVELICPDCGIKMNWEAKDGQCSVASLQHYRDGTMAIVCRSCNTRHAHMMGDSYKDIPKDHKHCPACLVVKPSSDYYAKNSRSGNLKRGSKCKSCANKELYEWRVKNKKRLFLYNQEWHRNKKSEKHAS
jgi:hypothetical protein